MQLVPVGALRFLTADPRADIARAAAALGTPVHTSSAGSGEAGAATPRGRPRAPAAPAPRRARPPPKHPRRRRAKPRRARRQKRARPRRHRRAPSSTAASAAPPRRAKRRPRPRPAELRPPARRAERGRLRQTARDRQVAVVQRRVGAIFGLFFLLLVVAAGTHGLSGRAARRGAAQGGQQRAAELRNGERAARHDHRPQRGRSGGLGTGPGHLGRPVPDHRPAGSGAAPGAAARPERRRAC